jgi:hypothetical protein
MSTATLNWTAPTTRTDGTPLSPSEIASFNIFDAIGIETSNQIGTVAGNITTFTTGSLVTGTHNFTVVVVDTTGHMSAASNVASVMVPVVLAAPSAITDLTAVITPPGPI